MCQEDELDDIVTFLKLKLPFSADINNKIKMYLYSNSKYNSGILEFNRFHFPKVEEGITTNKYDKEYLLRKQEVNNFEQALNYILTLDKDCRITENLICNIHQILFEKIDKLYAGQYRTFNVRVSSSTHIPPQYYKLDKKMNELINWYEENQSRIHPIKLAAIFHQKMVYIHPFADGNGRTARLIMNFILIKNDYPLVVFNEKIRKLYDTALERAAVKCDLEPFIKLVRNESYKTAMYIKKVIEEEYSVKKITIPIYSDNAGKYVVC